MSLWFRVLVFGLFALLTGESAMAAGRGSMDEYSVNGRAFYLYTPPGVDGRQTPLLVALHGGMGNAKSFQRTLPMQFQADRNSYRVIYIDGAAGARRIMQNRRTWNAGKCCGNAVKSGSNDVAHIASVIDALASQGLVDMSRVYFVGHSNGAMMAYRFACERPAYVRGIIALSGAFVALKCGNLNGVAIKAVHGSSDRNVPVAGGAGDQSVAGVAYPSLAETAAMLRTNGAGVEVVTVPSAGHDLGDLNEKLERATGLNIPKTISSFMAAN